MAKLRNYFCDTYLQSGIFVPGRYRLLTKLEKLASVDAGKVGRAMFWWTFGERKKKAMHVFCFGFTQQVNGSALHNYQSV